MDGYKVRFEHGRGHRMVLEGEPPIGSGEIDAIQYRMLRSCEIPGLLPLETEELDGVVALRYSLSGRRMLSQTLRSARWTMEDALSALCRVAEVLEMSREYMLDLERYVLDDDFIFAGEGWHDLAFTYMPLWRQTASVSVASGIERLTVRWMMNVDVPDGTAMQQLLRLASSPDFSPAQLRRYVRQYLAGQASTIDTEQQAERSRDSEMRPEAIPRWPSPAPDRAADVRYDMELARSTSEKENGSRGSGPFSLQEQEEEEGSQGLSGWLGEEPLWIGEEEAPEASVSPEAAGRRRIWLVAGAAAVTAAVWRFAYLPHPGSKGLLLSLGATLLAAGACFFLWDGCKPRKASGGSPRSAEKASSRIEGRRMKLSRASPANNGEGSAAAPPGLRAEPDAAPGAQPRRFGGSAALSSGFFGSGEYDSAEPHSEPSGDGTSWLGAHADGTRLLAEANASAAPALQYFLEWDSDGSRRRVRLNGDSLVIGRSKDAAQHIDGTEGVSRAHLELIRGQECWQARDLGSRNGSWLNGVPMAPYELYPLNKGDSIQIASSLYRYGEGS